MRLHNGRTRTRLFDGSTTTKAQANSSRSYCRNETSTKDSLARFARRKQSDDGSDRNPQAPNARLPAHDQRAKSNPIKFHSNLPK